MGAEANRTTVFFTNREPSNQSFEAPTTLPNSWATLEAFIDTLPLLEYKAPTMR